MMGEDREEDSIPDTDLSKMKNFIPDVSLEEIKRTSPPTLDANVIKLQKTKTTTLKAKKIEPSHPATILFKKAL
jgi:hypothetical protein